MTEAQAQTMEPQDTTASSLEGNIELHDYIHIIDGKPHIRAGDWHKTKWHTSRVLLESRLLQLLRHNALGIREQIGICTTRDMRDYQVEPDRALAFSNTNTKKLSKWKPKPKAKPTLGSETTAPTDGKEQREGKQAAARRQLTDAQVAEVRKRMARAVSPDTQEAVIAELSKRLGFAKQTIRDAATGRTYKRLPMPEAQATKPGKSGRKSKTAQAVEAAG